MMMSSMFSFFDAVQAEWNGQKLSFVPTTPKTEQKMIKDVSSPSTDHAGIEKGSRSDALPSPSPPAQVRKEQKRNLGPRFAPEFDGVYCFETIVPS